MLRAIELARRAEGRTAPNPIVGCVIVRDGAIIAEGWHEGPGKAHAEAAALAALPEGGATGASVYVSLEPCNHFGRTPPCAEALIRAGVREVVFAASDPNPIAAGGGARLSASGVFVRGGVCRDEGEALIRPWLHSVRHARPYVIAKAAMTLDGRIATNDGDSRWITGEWSRAAGHQLRRAADAIIVGANTVIADDPALSARIDRLITFPLRVVLDSTGRTPPGAKVYDRAGRGALLCATKAAGAARLAAYREHGVDVEILAADADGRPSPADILDALRVRGIVSVLIEGGGETLGAFLDADLIDEVALFIAPRLLGGGRPAFAGAGPQRLADAPSFDFEAPAALGDDMLIRGRRRREPR